MGGNKFLNVYSTSQCGLLLQSVNILKVIQAIVYQRSGAGNRHFCDLLAKIEHHINMILKYFSLEMPYTAIRAVSSLPVAGAKVALSVHTWLTKHKERPRITSFSCLFLSFFTVYTRKMPFLLLKPVDLRSP